MFESANQVATVDIKKLREHIKNNPINTRKQYRVLSNLASAAYIPSLADLNNLQKDLNQALNAEDLQAINQIKKRYETLLDTCFNDLCTWGKSALSEDQYAQLENTKSKVWNERLESYELYSIDPVSNQSLIIPAMKLAHDQFELLKRLPDDANKIMTLRQEIPPLKGIYDLKVEELKEAQTQTTKMDLDERHGFVIRNDGEYKRVEPGRGLDYQKDKLREYGVTEAQIDFIMYHSNQSEIAGVAPGMMPEAVPCTNLIVDIQPQPQGRPKVLLKSVAYNNVYDGDERFQFLGTIQLSIDISSLGEYAQYVPGTYENVTINLSSDFFYNKKAQLINDVNFIIPSKLLAKSNAEKFRKDYEDFGEGYLKSLSNEEILEKIDSRKAYPGVQQRYIAAKLFTRNNILDANFYGQVVEKVNSEPLGLNQETLDKAVADGVVTHVSKLLSSELENLGSNNPGLDNQRRKEITNRIYDSIILLIPGDAENVVK